jgi:hypothetical protein
MTGKKPKPRKSLYESGIPKTFLSVKVAIQFVIGFLLMLLLSIKGILHLINLWSTPINLIPAVNLLRLNVFYLIGIALGFSAGIELAYMLFTDGPDEAIRPLIMGVASAALFSIGGQSSDSWVIGVYSLSLLILLYSLKKYKEWKLNKPETTEEYSENNSLNERLSGVSREELETYLNNLPKKDLS